MLKCVISGKSSCTNDVILAVYIVKYIEVIDYDQNISWVVKEIMPIENLRPNIYNIARDLLKITKGGIHQI